MAGKSRFGGTGSQWKTSWRGRVPFDPINFIQGFGEAPEGQFYEGGAVLNVNPGGWFVGAVVGLQEVPSAPQTIAHNGGLADQGWTLDLVPSGSGLRARLRLYDGIVASPVETAGFPISLDNVGPVIGDPNRVYVAILAGFVSSALFPPDGASFIRVNVGTPPQPIANPYVNIVSELSVGEGDGGALLAPNVLHGIIGGVAPWDGTATQINNIYVPWLESIRAAGQIVALPDPAGIGVVTTHGWRAPGPTGEAPDPLAPFAGSVSLEYGVANTTVLELGSDQPAVFFPDNLAFPYAPSV